MVYIMHIEAFDPQLNVYGMENFHEQSIDELKNTLIAIYNNKFFNGVIVHEDGEMEFKDGSLVNILNYSDIIIH